MTSNDSHDQNIDWVQVARYLGGELAPSEARALEHWFERHDESRQFLAEARAAWDVSAPPTGDWDIEAGVRRLRRAAADAVPPLRSPRVLSLAWPKRQWFSTALAASLAAMTISGAALWSWYHRANPSRRTMSVAMTEVATPRGQRAVVLLPDGSRVTLSVASRLWYPRDFGVGARTVRLDGEAYFDVVHDAARPFRVRAGAGELEDVGTAFVVRAYDGQNLRVVVTEGSVLVRRLSTPRDSIVLTAAELAQVKEDSIIRQTGVHLDAYVAWTRGELVFKDATLSAIADELSRWYDVDVRADSTIAARRFTGSFSHRTADFATRAIAAATDVTVEHTASGLRFR